MKTPDDPPPKCESDIRAMLEQSRLDLVEGRTVPLKPILDRMRSVAQQIRQERAVKPDIAPSRV